MKEIKYPNGSQYKPSSNPLTTISKGMDLEAMINNTNQFYYQNNLAWVVKYPTPIHVMQTQGNFITKAVYNTPSCCDYIGFRKGHGFIFEAKTTQNKSRFYINQIAPHQLLHLHDALNQGCSAFIIVYFKIHQKTYFLDAAHLLNSIQNGVKSYTIEQFNQAHCLIESKNIQCPLDYLSFIM